MLLSKTELEDARLSLTAQARSAGARARERRQL